MKPKLKKFLEGSTLYNKMFPKYKIQERTHGDGRKDYIILERDGFDYSWMLEPHLTPNFAFDDEQKLTRYDGCSVVLDFHKYDTLYEAKKAMNTYIEYGPLKIGAYFIAPVFNIDTCSFCAPDDVRHNVRGRILDELMSNGMMMWYSDYHCATKWWRSADHFGQGEFRYIEVGGYNKIIDTLYELNNKEKERERKLYNESIIRKEIVWP